MAEEQKNHDGGVEEMEEAGEQADGANNGDANGSSPRTFAHPPTATFDRLLPIYI